MAVNIAEALELSVAERVRLVEVIWNSILEVPDAVPLTEAQRNILDRRLSDFHSNPSDGSLWADVKDRILGRK